MTTRVPSFLASSGFAARCSRASTPFTKSGEKEKLLSLALPSRPLHMGVTPPGDTGERREENFFLSPHSDFEEKQSRLFCSRDW